MIIKKLLNCIKSGFERIVRKSDEGKRAVCVRSFFRESVKDIPNPQFCRQSTKAFVTLHLPLYEYL